MVEVGNVHKDQAEEDTQDNIRQAEGDNKEEGRIAKEEEEEVVVEVHEEGKEHLVSSFSREEHFHRIVHVGWVLKVVGVIALFSHWLLLLSWSKWKWKWKKRERAEEGERGYYCNLDGQEEPL